MIDNNYATATVVFKDGRQQQDSLYFNSALYNWFWAVSLVTGETIKDAIDNLAKRMESKEAYYAIVQNRNEKGKLLRS